MATVSLEVEQQQAAAQRVPLPEVLTLAETAAFLRVSEEAVLRLYGNESLPGRKIDSEWRFLKRGVEDWLRKQSPKSALLAQAGALKDDPYLDEMMKNIQAERERQRDEGL